MVKKWTRIGAVLTVLALALYPSVPRNLATTTALAASSCISPTNENIVIPTGFTPLRASDAELACYGFPPRPRDAAGLADWTKAMLHSITRVHYSGLPGIQANQLVMPNTITPNTITTPGIWSGYKIGQFSSTIRQFTAASMWLMVPPSGPYDGKDESSWVGLGGTDPSEELYQAGVHANGTSNTKPDHYFFYNVNVGPHLPPPPNDKEGADVPISYSDLAVDEGQEVFISVTHRDSNMSLLIYLLNVTTNKYLSLDEMPGTNAPYMSAETTAEWITEDTIPQYFAQYNPVTFVSGLDATSNVLGSVTLQNQPHYAYGMGPSGSNPSYAMAPDITRGDGFDNCPVDNDPTPAECRKFVEYPSPIHGGSPNWITRGPDNNLWFVDWNTGLVGKIDPNGGFYFTYSTGNSGAQLAMIAKGGDGNLWFTAITGNYVGKITTAPIPTVTTFAMPANSAPRGITPGLDSSSVWIADWGTPNIIKMDESGNILVNHTISSIASGIAANTTTNTIWYDEYYTNKIGVYNPSTGTDTLYSIPTPSSKPYDITLGPDGAMWFTEYASSKIGRIDSSGHFSEYQIPTTNSEPDQIISAGGNLWFAESNTGRIGKITISPQVSIAEYSIPSYIGGTSNPSAATSLAMDANGNVWVTQPNRNSVAVRTFP